MSETYTMRQLREMDEALERATRPDTQTEVEFLKAMLHCRNVLKELYYLTRPKSEEWQKLRRMLEQTQQAALQASEQSSSGDTVTPAETWRTYSTSLTWLSGVNPDGTVSRSVAQGILDWLSSMRTPGDGLEAEIGLTLTLKDSTLLSGSLSPSTEAQTRSLNGPAGDARRCGLLDKHLPHKWGDIHNPQFWCDGRQPASPNPVSTPSEEEMHEHWWTILEPHALVTGRPPATNEKAWCQDCGGLWVNGTVLPVHASSTRQPQEGNR